ncbi:hypothetical protein E5288_WYG006612 [Bos mutus]|uniref:Uncharacterized protein n=1 Tax=Bos mutus TaxID=72004 RepID=A0A6B0RDZ8_9CETA|nr:hypothetical protein [Bos mutus]
MYTPSLYLLQGFEGPEQAVIHSQLCCSSGQTKSTKVPSNTTGRSSREGERDVDLCHLGDLERLLCGEREWLPLRSPFLDWDLSWSVNPYHKGKINEAMNNEKTRVVTKTEKFH